MTLTQTDFNLIMKKLDKFEEELKKLKKDVKVLSVFVDAHLVKKYYGGVPGGGMSFIDLPRVLSQGSLVDSETTQEWRVAKSTDDVEE